MNDASPADAGHNPVSDDVWKQIREDYLSGWSAPACARRYGVGLSTVRKRAADEKWRRGDQPPSLPMGLDRDDVGLALEERFDGDLDRIPLGELIIVAFQRMTRAVLHGNAAEALRWRRVRQALDAERDRVVEIHRLERLRREQEARKTRPRQSARLEAMREETRAMATACRRLDVLETGAGGIDGLDGLDALDGVFAPSPPSPFILPGLPVGRAPSGPP
ncbi:hypothetical protein [Brevundimonas sp.]|uniref:hypothetical protein n=1 Tax=Brevundimonas sp. TaxID=1871086 RepID=UPI003F7097C4